MLVKSKLFTDGGIVLKNPSVIGGSWAWCLVSEDDQTVLAQASGVVTPAQIGLPSVENNFTELLAAVQGLEAMAPHWGGNVYTDSLVTKLRLTDSLSFKGIPDDLRNRCLIARRKILGSVVLLGGHPSKQNLEFEYIPKKNLPCSRWNVWCDKECKRIQLETFRGAPCLPSVPT